MMVWGLSLSRSHAWGCSHYVHPRKNSPQSTVRCQAHGKDTPSRQGRREVLLGGISTLGLCGCGACARKRGGLYDKYFAYSLSHTMARYEELIAPTKIKLFKALADTGARNILEVGVGYGPNVPYYQNPDILKITGLDPNPEMESYAYKNAELSNLKSFEFLEGYAESIPVENNVFDAAVCTLVLCSVMDVEAALKEMQRVVKPGGGFLFIEHVSAPAGSLRLVEQKILTPLQQALADGCHLDRNTLQFIEGAGFSRTEAQSFEVNGLGPLSPHVAGISFI